MEAQVPRPVAATADGLGGTYRAVVEFAPCPVVVSPLVPVMRVLHSTGGAR
jgi:hypothetical protein